MRRFRTVVAAWLIALTGFAQGATFAHACPVTDSAWRSLTQAMAEQAGMPADCHGMARPAVPTRNACVSHCFAGDEVAGQADLGAATVAALAPLVLERADARRAAISALPAPPSPSAAPPPQLLYARFLI